MYISPIESEGCPTHPVAILSSQEFALPSDFFIRKNQSHEAGWRAWIETNTLRDT